MIHITVQILVGDSETELVIVDLTEGLVSDAEGVSAEAYAHIRGQIERMGQDARDRALGQLAAVERLVLGAGQ